MTTPSASNMKFKFPRFVNVDDGAIEFAIEEAVVACGDDTNVGGTGWISDGDRILAIQYYAAHLLELSIQRSGSGTGQLVTSERTPDLSMSYSVPPWPDPEKPIDFTQTIYGTRFLTLVQKNFPAVLVVNSAVRM